MLVLSRKENEIIRIGDDIKIQVVQLRDGQVRLGIEAPREIAVHREEIYERIKQQANPSQEQKHAPAAGVLPAAEIQAH